MIGQDWEPERVDDDASLHGHGEEQDMADAASTGTQSTYVANSCVVCGADPPIFICRGQSNGGCIYNQMLCDVCRVEGDQLCILCRRPGMDYVVPRSHKRVDKAVFCRDCGHRFQEQELIDCKVCRRRVCNGCAVMPWKQKKIVYICFSDCIGGDEKISGFQKRCMEAAQKIMEQVLQCIEEDHLASTRETQRKRALKLLYEFGDCLVNVSSALQLSLLDKMWPVFERTAQYLEKNSFAPSITLGQCMRLHLPRGLLRKWLPRIASQHEQYNETQLKKKGHWFDWKPIQERQRLRRAEEVAGAGFLLYDCYELHPLAYLLFDLLMRLLLDPAVDCFIFALQEPRPSETETVLTMLYREFSAAGRWIQTTPEKCRQDVQSKRLDLFVDCVAEQHGCLDVECRPRPGVDAHVVVHYLNVASCLYGPKFWDFVILDQLMKSALPDSGAAPNGPSDSDLPQREGALVVSSWQPGIARHYLDPLAPIPRAQRSSSEAPFNILSVVYLNRKGEEQYMVLFRLLREMPRAILHLTSHPCCCVKEVELLALMYALKHNLGDDFFRRRIVCMGYLPFERYMEQLKPVVHVVVSWGGYPGHTAYQTGLAIAPAVTVEGDTPAAMVPAAMNRFTGLAALTVPYGSSEQVEQGIVRIVQQLYDDEDLRSRLSGHLESLVLDRKSLFDCEHTVRDMKAILDAVVHRRLPTPGAGQDSDQCFEFVSHPPEPPLLYTDANGKLHLQEADARAVGPNESASIFEQDVGEKRSRSSVHCREPTSVVFPSTPPCAEEPVDDLFGVINFAEKRRRKLDICGERSKQGCPDDEPPAEDIPAITAENVQDASMDISKLSYCPDLLDGRGLCQCSIDWCLCPDWNVAPGSIQLQVGRPVKFPEPASIESEMARYPYSFRRVPAEMTKEELQAVTVGPNNPLEKTLEKGGLGLLQANDLGESPELKPLSLASDQKLHALQKTDPPNFEGFKDELFQDPPRTLNGSGIETGDGSKTMSAPFSTAFCSEVLAFARAVVKKTMGEEFEVHGKSACALFGRKDQPYSGEPNCQAHHNDLHCHLLNAYGPGRLGVVDENVLHYARTATSPRVFVMNTASDPIRLAVWIGSHILVTECVRYFARHYAALFDAWSTQPENAGKTESEFHPYYSACVDQHLRKRFPGQEPIQPKALTLQPGDAVCMLGSFVHAGISDWGLRIFFIVLATSKHLKSQGLSGEQFLIPDKGKSDPLETSWVTAGMWRLCPSPESVANTYYTRYAITKDFKAFVKSSIPGCVRRQQVSSLQESLWAALSRQADLSGCELTDTVLQIVSSVTSLGAHHVQAGVAGVVCKIRGGEEHSVIWLGERIRGADCTGRNSPVVRGAVIAAQLLARLKRSKWDCHPVGQPSHVRRSEILGSSRVIFSSVVALEGVPMDKYFQDHFEKDCAQVRLLTEPFRWFTLGFFETVDALHIKGYRLVMLSLACFAYNPRTDKVQLIQPGFGALVEETTARCNRGSFRGGAGPIFMNRQTTNYYVEAAANGASAPSSVDTGNLRALRKDQQAATGSEKEGGEDDDLRAAEEVEQLLARGEEVELELPRLVGWSRDKQRGKPWGMIGEPAKFLYPEMNPFQPGSDRPLDPEALLISDKHQLTLQVVSWFRPIPPGQLSVWKKDLQKVLGRTVQEAEAEMATFLAKGTGGKGAKFQQPAALGRLAQHLVWSLHPDTRGEFIHEASSSVFCATPVHSPEREAQLASPEGIPMTIRVDALEGDEDWKILAAKSLKDAGFKIEGLDELRRNPRKACLKNEAEKGVGFYAFGKWEEGTFGLWYVGLASQHGIRRYSVTLHDGAGRYCDAEACRRLELNWLIENGPGAFVNGTESLAISNLELLGKHFFEHKGLVWIPMRVRTTFADTFGGWKYNPKADKGCSRLM